jgi:hypothetical protein
LCSFALLPVSPPARPNYTRIHSRIFLAGSVRCVVLLDEFCGNGAGQPYAAERRENFLTFWSGRAMWQLSSVRLQGFKRSNQPGTLLPRRADAKTGWLVFRHSSLYDWNTRTGN